MKSFKQRFGMAIIFLGILLGHLSLITSLFSGGAYAQAPIGSNISPAPPDGFGWVTRSIADLDGDGVRDIAVGAPQTGTIYPTATGAGAVYIYSGRTGSLIRTISNPNGTEQSIFGWYMVEAGDLGRDGKSDLLVSAPFSGTTSYGFDGPGSAYAISGADGHVIYR
ncbi:MAG: FG-GAP repeat protein, partial [Nitrospirae bacterium]|nr:FG-GAP repeat protein [Nitrospirota bacterium]